MKAGSVEPEQPTLAAGQEWLMCRVDTHLCGLPLPSVIETMRPLPIERLKQAPGFVAGVSIIRGEPVPVVDMRLLMGMAPGSATRVVTVRAGDRAAALAFDAVLGLRTMEATQTATLPPLVKSLTDDIVTAVAARDNDLILFLETARILPPAFLADMTKTLPVAAPKGAL